MIQGKALQIGIGMMVLAIAAGIAWWMLRPDVQAPPAPLSAQAAVEQACERVEDIDYDGTFIETTPQQELVITGTVEYSGQDSYRESVLTSPDGTLVGRAELIVVDEIWYGREARGESEKFEDWLIVGQGAPMQSVPICSSTDKAASGDDSSSEERLYVSDFDMDSGTLHQKGTSEIWVNSDGYPSRSRFTRTTTYASGSTITQVTEMTFSGFGEPNVITAPIIPTDTG